MSADRAQDAKEASQSASLAACLPVHLWPDALPARSDATGCAPDVFVIAVRTDDGQQRERARRQIREAIRAALVKLLDIDAAAITLPAAQGSAPRIVLDRSERDRTGLEYIGLEHIGLSISHEAGLSLAAINLRGAIGVDLMRVQEQLDADWEIVARDYLGPATAQALALIDVAHRAAAFAGAWTAREANLKCHGLPLQEWTATIASCQTSTLLLPDGYAGSVALAG